MINFAKVEASVQNLKAQFTAGHIDDKMFEDKLLELVDIASDGHYWMFGHETETWFRHDGEQWVRDVPLQAQQFSRSSANGKTPVEADPDWRTISPGWFLASLVIIAAIGGIIYYSV